MTIVNVYPITNLGDLRCKYRLFKIRGISPTSEDYDKNSQYLIDKLSRQTKSPCAIWKENGELFIAQPVGCQELPKTFPLVGTMATIEQTAIEREVNYNALTPDILPLALRFLQFYMDRPLYNSPHLWRPRPGSPFYQKVPDEVFSAASRDVNMYKGFKVKLIALPGGKIGICVDVTRLYAAKVTLPWKITPDEFRKYKGRKFIYEYADRWYVIQVTGLSDYNVSEVQMPDGTSLFKHIHDKCKNHKPQSVLMMPSDSSVFTYQTSMGAIRNVPTALCRQTFKTNHSQVKRFHSKTIVPPYAKRREIEFFVNSFLRHLNFQGVPIMLSDRMMQVETGVLTPPDLMFGNGKILSFNSHNGNAHTTLDMFSRMKVSMLNSSEAGYYRREPLDQQYIVMPKSIMATFGETYIEDIKAQVKKTYAPDGKYEYRPSVIEYDDSGRNSIYELGNKIIEAIMPNIFYSGYGLVVIPRLQSDKGNKEDALANLLMGELRKKSVHVSISHTEVPQKSYSQTVTTDGLTSWQITRDPELSSRFRGYLNNMVLNKILLLNSCWPFVLAKPLNADVTIGIDVKNTTAAFVVILKDGRTFAFHTSPTEEKEQLTRKHLAKKIYDMLKADLAGQKITAKYIVIHRDGKMFPGEIRGIKEALAKLAEEGIIAKDFDCNFVEIRKSSSIPVRFFETQYDQGREWTNNPQYGTYKIFDNNAFLCTTGRPFRFPGTTRPLHVIKIEGGMSLGSILQDIFALSNLTYTKIDSCSREPLSIKMADIRLREVAGDYELDSLQFGEDE